MLNISRIGEGIKSDYRVTHHLEAFFLFMPSAFNTIQTNDFMDPYCLAQLADDTLIYSENFTNLKTKFEAILKLSYMSHRHTDIR